MMTWYIWELLGSEARLAVGDLADEAVQRGTVDDQGAAGLAQKTLEEPEEHQRTGRTEVKGACEGPCWVRRTGDLPGCMAVCNDFNKLKYKYMCVLNAS